MEEIKTNYEEEVTTLKHKLRESIKKEKIDFTFDEFEDYA